MKLMKRRKKIRTGLVGPLPFRLGELSRSQIGSPHSTDALDKSPVEHLFQIADRNVRELFARAYHQSRDRWDSPWTDPGDMEPERGKEDREARESLLKSLNSPNSKKRRAAKIVRKQLLELNEREARNAATLLAHLGQQIAFSLERLADECPELMKPIGRHFSSWPFNLALTKRKTTGKRDLLRVNVAKRCLLELEIGLKHTYVDENAGGKARPLRVAAGQVYDFLRDVRSRPHEYFPTRKIEKSPGERRIPLAPMTPWAERLVELEEPMTVANFNEWWGVAKDFLLEIWDEQHEQFDCLIQFTKQNKRFEPATFKPGKAKARIIDQSLKPHFKTLAVPQ